MSLPQICYQCLLPPTTDQSLQRCGRCQSRLYCSKDCQRLDWIIGSHKKQCEPPAADATPPPIDLIDGVRLHCRKDGGGWIGTKIPNNHVIFNSYVMPVPGLLEIPLVIHRVGTQSLDQADLDCQIATYLNIHPVTGLAPTQWLSNIGTCVIGRKDRKPLSPQHLELVYMFIDGLLDDFGDVGPEKAREAMTRERFEKFAEVYRRNELKKGREERWADVRSIYDV
ncbi:hypothetical protein B0J11DRAFT_230859 [Dendryphion nanum]|uniref:MYND-type domain-containing protein n=1 Tax=Dendryphion nanum TaxID=256645 RepID=A0A9P9ITA3_9PLEO|nr:hypothetical protein B0J11DRAFT_230859 [Dendryphion nanum]